MPASLVRPQTSTSPIHYDVEGYNTPLEAPHPNDLSRKGQSRCWPGTWLCASSDELTGVDVPMPDTKRFPFNNFTCCFTLFSKYFSSFDHSTCLLSVSRQYLALDGIYHPFRAAFPNNPTLRGHDARTTEIEPQTGLSPSVTSYSKVNWTRSTSADASLAYNSGFDARFQT